MLPRHSISRHVVAGFQPAFGNATILDSRFCKRRLKAGDYMPDSYSPSPRTAQGLLHGDGKLLYEREISRRGDRHIVAAKAEPPAPKRIENHVPLEPAGFDFYINRF